MIDWRSLLRGLTRRLAILLIVVATATVLLVGAATIGSDDFPGSGLSPGEFVSSGEAATTDGSLYLDRTGQPTVVGEIDNDVGDPITNVVVTVTIYEDGEAVATRETAPLASTIPDGTAVPFEVRFAADADPDEYTANVSYDAGSDLGSEIELDETRETDVTQDSVTIAGSMTNVDDATAKQPLAIVTFYDDEGAVIGARTDRISPLEPGETGEFGVRYSTLGDVPSLAREYAEYAVVAVDTGGD